MKGGVFAAIDVGTTKVCTVVGEAVPEQPLRILGVGIAAANGLNRGMVENLRDASESIRASVEQAERSSGTRILSAHVIIYRLSCDHCRVHFEQLMIEPIVDRQLVLIRVPEPDNPSDVITEVKPPADVEHAISFDE